MNSNIPIQKVNCSSEEIQVEISTAYAPLNFLIFGPEDSGIEEKINNISIDYFECGDKSSIHSKETEDLLSNIIGKKTLMEGIWEQTQKDHQLRSKKNYFIAELNKISLLKPIKKAFPSIKKFLADEKQWWIDSPTSKVRHSLGCPKPVTDQVLACLIDKKTEKKYQFNLKEKLFWGLIEIGLIRKSKIENKSMWYKKSNFLDTTDRIAL